MSNKNKKYYKNNYYNKNNKKPDTKTNKVTYDSLLNANIDVNYDNTDISKLQIAKLIALTVVLFTIIVCSLILFKYS